MIDKERAWAEKTVGELCLRVTSGGTPSRSNSDFYLNGTVPWIKSGELPDGYVTKYDEYISTEAIANSSAKILPKNTVLMAMYGATVGMLGILSEPAACNQAACAMVVHREKADPRWLFYALKNDRDHIVSRANGAAQQNLSGGTIKGLSFIAPGLMEQQAIAEVLGALDDKIAANTGITLRLDPFLRSIFSSLVGWPDERVWLSELVTVSKGVSYRSIDLLPSVTALVTLKSFDRLGGYAARGLKDYVGPYKGMQVISAGEIAVAQTDLTQAAEVVGRAIRVPASEKHQTLVASLDLAVLRPVGEMPVEFLLGLLSQGGFREHCKSHTSGTTVLHLAPNAIATFRTPVVSHDVQLAYASRARPILEMGDSLDRENVILAATRDALLPQLMSGKLRVRDAETAVEAVV